MTVRVCPGHISCIFQPVRSPDCMRTGSRGVGIRLDRGARAEVFRRDDGEVRITLNGRASDAPVTRAACAILAPGEGFDIAVDTDLPVSQGFGMSAAGTIAASLCIGDIIGLPLRDVYAAAHRAEVMMRGGLGDVPAIAACEHIPVRAEAGLSGCTGGALFRFEELSVAVFDGKVETSSVLRDASAVERISEAGREATDMFLADPTKEALFSLSERFAERAGLIPAELGEVLGSIRSEGYRAGRCMLGNSVFSDAPASELRAIVGDGPAVIRCRSDDSDVLARRA